MSFSLHITHSAKKSLDKLSDKTTAKILLHLEELQSDPFKPRPGVDIVKIQGRKAPPAYRLRLGNLRIEYVVFEREKLIRIIRIFRRSGDSDYR
jgi:mRNA-degrading endonuclease RelE of RelBE toxin-antitoxin system